MRMAARGMGMPFAWFDTHRSDLAGLAILAAVVVLLVLFVKLARE